MEDKILKIKKLIDYNDNLIKEIKNKQTELIEKINEITELIKTL